MRPTVPTYWWNEQPNVGDAMNPLLLDRLFRITAVWAPLTSAELTASGSLVQWITPIAGDRASPVHVWGSGFIFDEEPAPPADAVRYAAVRGEKSVALAGLSLDTTTGDPGLLASRVIDRPRRSGGIGFVPHLWHLNDPVLGALVTSVNGIVVDVRGDPLTVISQIASCSFVLSSSLHGLILADSYGIPNAWLTFDRAMFGGTWKFDDYYSAFNLTSEPVHAHADLDVPSLIDDVTEQYARPGLSRIQDELFAAFPLGS